MRILIQRVNYGRVSVNGETSAKIDRGLVILVGVGQGDTPEQAAWLAEKTANLRIFEDADGKMNLSVKEIGGEAIAVSQFTLYADSQKGRRPSFIQAAAPEMAAPLVDMFAKLLREHGVPCGQGVFGAEMLVEIHNDGPVTIWMEK